jgi:hypothetical protein
MRHHLPLPVAVLLAIPAAPVVVRAQSPADSAALADAVVQVVRDSVLGRLAAATFRGEARTAFDRLVDVRLAAAPGLARLSHQRDTADWVNTSGAVLRGDTADVLLQVGTTAREHPIREGIDTYVETRRYRFVREGGRWRLLGREFLGGADFGSVRG